MLAQLRVRLYEDIDVLFRQVWHFDFVQQKFLELGTRHTLHLTRLCGWIPHEQDVKQQVQVVEVGFG